ncbi:unnamed protein product [Vitrella brassicaformis CCMP3155]|uniref:Expansin-like EG45 domain-containing protein n=1 Tax=Vitrella brassicaformis (strain CCMP3155) TaxID=1169540 RepID=A0A0G4GKH9_VITBC|nr:unnamed protein product [Vitrella brassicaformis CCMP3155]|eukprot:CEM30540.1 unnamed protein product [Vitrella brassicaformis CCMP3155]
MRAAVLLGVMAVHVALPLVSGLDEVSQEDVVGLYATYKEGMASYYKLTSGDTGSCHHLPLEELPDTAFEDIDGYVALPEMHYLHARTCGMCIEVEHNGQGSGTGPSLTEKFKLYVIGVCKHCDAHEIAIMDDNHEGLYHASWKAVDCTTSSTIHLAFAGEENTYKLQFQHRNFIVPVWKLEIYYEPTDTWLNCPWKEWPVFLCDADEIVGRHPFPNDGFSLPLYLRLTSITGEERYTKLYLILSEWHAVETDVQFTGIDGDDGGSGSSTTPMPTPTKGMSSTTTLPPTTATPTGAGNTASIPPMMAVATAPPPGGAAGTGSPLVSSSSTNPPSTSTTTPMPSSTVDPRNQVSPSACPSEAFAGFISCDMSYVGNTGNGVVGWLQNCGRFGPNIHQVIYELRVDGIKEVTISTMNEESKAMDSLLGMTSVCQPDQGAVPMPGKMCVDDVGGTLQSKIMMEVADTMYVVVGAYKDSSGYFKLTVSCTEAGGSGSSYDPVLSAYEEEAYGPESTALGKTSSKTDVTTRDKEEIIMAKIAQVKERKRREEAERREKRERRRAAEATAGAQRVVGAAAGGADVLTPDEGRAKTAKATASGLGLTPLYAGVTLKSPDTSTTSSTSSGNSNLRRDDGYYEDGDEVVTIGGPPARQDEVADANHTQPKVTKQGMSVYGQDYGDDKGYTISSQSTAEAAIQALRAADKAAPGFLHLPSAANVKPTYASASRRRLGECFETGVMYDINALVLYPAPKETPLDCQGACQEISSCHYFTHVQGDIANAVPPKCYVIHTREREPGMGTDKVEGLGEGVVSGLKDCSIIEYELGGIDVVDMDRMPIQELENGTVLSLSELSNFTLEAHIIEPKLDLHTNETEVEPILITWSLTGSLTGPNETSPIPPGTLGGKQLPLVNDGDSVRRWSAIPGDYTVTAILESPTTSLNDMVEVIFKVVD